MIELREVDTARAMLRQTAVFTRMKQEEPDRFLRLEHLCGKTYFDIRCALSTRDEFSNHSGPLSSYCSGRPCLPGPLINPLQQPFPVA